MIKVILRGQKESYISPKTSYTHRGCNILQIIQQYRMLHFFESYRTLFNSQLSKKKRIVCLIANARTSTLETQIIQLKVSTKPQQKVNSLIGYLEDIIIKDLI